VNVVGDELSAEWLWGFVVEVRRPRKPDTRNSKSEIFLQQRRRAKKERQLVDEIRSRSYHDQHLYQPKASAAPLLSRLRNLNNLAITSIGSIFSGPAIGEDCGSYCKLIVTKMKRSYLNVALVASCRHRMNANANRGACCLWDEDPQNCVLNYESTPVGNDYDDPEAVDYCSVKTQSILGDDLGRTKFWNWTHFSDADAFSQEWFTSRTTC